RGRGRRPRRGARSRGCGGGLRGHGGEAGAGAGFGELATAVARRPEERAGDVASTCSRSGRIQATIATGASLASVFVPRTWPMPRSSSMSAWRAPVTGARRDERIDAAAHATDPRPTRVGVVFTLCEGGRDGRGDRDHLRRERDDFLRLADR